MNKRAPLPEGTIKGKSHEYGVEVGIGEDFDNPVWQAIRRMFGFTNPPTPQTADARTYDSFGSPEENVDGWSIALGFSVQVNRSKSTGLYLPEIEALLERTGPDAVDDAALIPVRWFHKPEKGTPNPHDAGQGLFRVTYQRSNTGPDGSIEVFAFTLNSVGPYEKIENPWGGWPGEVPNLLTATPAAAAAGEQVTIKGAGFQNPDGSGRVTGAAGVKFGGTNASSYTVVSPTLIVAIMPAGSAGSAALVVTNDVGASPAFPYTRGA